jgi:protein KRI1
MLVGLTLVDLLDLNDILRRREKAKAKPKLCECEGEVRTTDMSKVKLNTLLESSSDEEEEQNRTGQGTSNGLTINSNYASAYQRFREKELFQKLKDKYGEAAAKEKLEANADRQNDSDDSESESEDDDAKEWTEDMDRDFFKTLASLKGNDPKIYDSSQNFFNQKSPIKGGQKKGKKTQEKPLHLADFEREVMVKREGQFDEVEDEELARKSYTKTYVQEQEEIRQSLKKALNDDSDIEGAAKEEDEGFLKAKVKSKEEIKNEEEDYKKWLAGRQDSLGDADAEKNMKGLREFWTSSKLDKDEKFLRDYVLNKWYLGDDEENDEGDNEDDDERNHPLHDSDQDLSEDERTLDKMEEFEQKFNFRFEEPDSEFIKRYPRTVAESMRKKDTKRKDKRDEIKQRKEEERRKRDEELKQLKALKR